MEPIACVSQTWSLISQQPWEGAISLPATGRNYRVNGLAKIPLVGRERIIIQVQPHLTLGPSGRRLGQSRAVALGPG